MRNKWLVSFLAATGGLLLSGSALADDETVTSMEVREYDLTIRNETGDACTFPKGIYLEGDSLYGLTKDQALAKMQQDVETRQTRAITLSVLGDNIYQYNAGSFSVSWTNPELADSLDQYLAEGNFIEQYKLQKDLENHPIDLQLEFTYDQQFLADTVNALVQNFTASPQNAYIQATEQGFQITPEVYGQTFDADSIFAELNSLISDYDNTEGIYYDFPHSTTEPQYKTADFMFDSTPLGSYQTGNLGIENRVSNIKLSAARVNGTILYPGQEASALDLYGPQTLENGYLIAPGYENGNQVDAVGGGVCQTTTTLYNALIRAEVTITKRQAHSMIVTYVPPALDAAVATGAKDLMFRNDFSHPIYIECYVNSGILGVNIWGIDEHPERRVDFSWSVEAVEWPNPLYTVVVDDSQVTYGPDAMMSQKITAPVECHPRVVARSYKHIYTLQEDGTEVEQIENFNYDAYRAMTGLLYVASDCIVTTTPVVTSDSTAVYKYLGWDLYHKITFKNGEDWNPVTADENYTP